MLQVIQLTFNQLPCALVYGNNQKVTEKLL